MSIFLGDLRIKAMIEIGLDDIAKNPWVIDDILGDTIANQYLRDRYSSQIGSCKQWIANNRINIYMSDRDDKVEFPCVTIEMGVSSEKSEMRHMGDLSTETVKLLPNNINKPIPYVIKPSMGSYDPTSGAFSFSSPIALNTVAVGMIIVNPTNGNGYIVQSITTANQVNLLPNLTIPTGIYGIIPEFQYYETRIGHTFMDEPYKITCHGLDQQTLLWMHSIMVYSLLRYRQALLESDGYAQSSISSGKMYPNPDHSSSAQIIWSRDINLTGQVENRWYMQPHRIIETVSLGTGGGPIGTVGGTGTSGTAGGTGTDSTYIGGIKIISNITDTFEDLSNVNWCTIAESLGDSE